MSMKSEIEQLIKERNLTIVDFKEFVISRKDRMGKTEKSFSFVCKCPTKDCTNTFSIARKRDLDRTCRSCSVRGTLKADKISQNWYVFTTDWTKSSLPLAKANSNLFIREEHTKNKANGTAKRIILRCSTPDCNGEISTNRIMAQKLLRDKCNRCAQKSRPYERTYNIAQKRMHVRFPDGDIKWLLSYEEFASLCEIPNCHYCNRLLNRAKHRTMEKQSQHTLACLIDRKDSNKDYTLDNCVPCCPDCNFTKHEHISYDEMILIMKYRGLWVEDKQL